MSRYFFDIFDGGAFTDDVGQELANDAAVRKEAMRALPDIARDEIPKAGDKQGYTVIVRNEDGRPVYSATLSFAGVWLRAEAAE